MLKQKFKTIADKIYKKYMHNKRTTLETEVKASGAIHPSVPAKPDRLDIEFLLIFSRLHKPKSDISARTTPC